MAVIEAESKRAPRKNLRAVEITPHFGGGATITHHYDGMHESKPHKFNADGKMQGGEHWVDHIAKHTGLPHPEGTTEYDHKDESETEDRIEA